MSSEITPKEFTTFIFSSVLGEEVVKKVAEEEDYFNTHGLPVAQFIKQTREFANISAKEQLRVVALRYKITTELLRKSKYPKLFLINDEQFSNIGGFSLNNGAFWVTIDLLGTDKQRHYWGDLVFKGKVIGAYAQTELGHGSNVQALQTEAHYQPQTDSFKLISSKSTSAKFWPGLLGIFSTHAVLQVKTFVNKKFIGIQTFIVEIRDQNLNALPGIEVGDIGAKMGFERVDNGYLLLNNVQVPREHMLMKYIQVEKDGTVKGLENKMQATKYGYGSMLNLRVRLTNGFAIHLLARAVIDMNLVAQKLNLNGERDVKKFIIEGLCTAYGFTIANLHTMNLFSKFLQGIRKSNFDQADEYLIQCHILSATIKALSSWKAKQILTKQLTSNHLNTFKSSLSTDHFRELVPSVTYQGDNSVLLQQTAKFVLMKDNDIDQKPQPKPMSEVNPDDLHSCLKALQYVTHQQALRIKALFEKDTDKNVPFNTFWNEKYQRELIELSKLWGAKSLINSLIISLEAITTHHDFYLKICKVFASVLLEQNVPALPFYGISVKASNTWESFSENEFKSMVSIDFLRQGQSQYITKYTRHDLPQRNVEWTKPRL